MGSLGKLLNKIYEDKKTICVVLLVLFGMFLLFHTQYSFCQSDESFYLSTVKKLYQGQRLVLDEWHPTQFYSPLLLPFYVLYRFVSGTEEGIILYFRIIMVLFSGFSSLLLFDEVRKNHSTFISFISSVFLLLFSRANICGTSYYNLNLLFIILAFIMWRRALGESDFSRRIHLILCGLFISSSVLCQPYCAVAAVLFATLLFTDKKTRKNALTVICTVIIAATVYIILFLMKGKISSYRTSLWYVLNNPQHLTGLIPSVVSAVKNHKFILSKACCLFSLIISLWFFISRLRGNHLTKRQVLCQLILLSVTIIKPILKISTIPCYSFYAAVTVAAFPAFLYYLKKPDTKMESQLYVIGLFTAVTWSVGSNTGIDAMMVGYIISGIGGLLLIDTILKESNHFESPGKLACYIFKLISVLLLLCAFLQRTFGFYRDAPFSMLDTRITEGPAKGLITTENAAAEYDSIYTSINVMYEQNPDATVLHAKRVPWAYLCCDWKAYGATTWTTEINSDLILDYYNLHDGVLPDYCFIYSSTQGGYIGNFWNNHKTDKFLNEIELSGEFYDILQSNYNAIKKPYFTVFVKKETGF